MASEAANEIRQLASVLEKLSEGVSSLQSGVDELRNDLRDDRKKGKEKDKDAPSKDKDKLSFGASVLMSTLQGVINGLSAIPSILSQQAQSARSFAQQSGTTFTDAIRIERQARDVIAAQATRFGAEEMNTEVRMESLKRNAAGFITAMGGLPEGMQLNTKKFGEELLPSFMGALNTENFTFSTDVMRAMGIAGIKTADDLKAFRQATGKQSMSSEYLSALINKNALSFSLYGMQFAKAADRAERLGISLEGVRSAQEAGVGNVEGLLDAVNQLNQLGATLDFTELLTLAEFGDPEAFKNYILANVPAEFSRMASTRLLAKSGLGLDVADIRARESAIKTPETILPTVAEKAQTPEEATAGSRSFFTKLIEKFNQAVEGSPIIGNIVRYGGAGAIGAVTLKGTQMIKASMSGAAAAKAAADAAAAAEAAAEAATATRAVQTGLTGTRALQLPGISTQAVTAAEGAAAASKGVQATTAAAEAGLLARTSATLAKIPGASFLGKIATPVMAGFGVFEGMKAIAADPDAPFMRRFGNYLQGFTSSITFGLIGKKADEIRQEREEREFAEERILRDQAIARGRAAARNRVAAGMEATALSPTTPLGVTAPVAADSSARMIAKTEELVTVLKGLNIPELANAIKTADKTIEISIDGQRVTIPGVGLTGARLRNDTLTVRR